MPYQSHWDEESQSREDILKLPGSVVLEFGAEWCPHCQAVQDLLKNSLENRDVTHIKVSDGKGKRLGRAFQVKLWPNFVFVKNGQVIEQLARPQQVQLKATLERL